ncbi:MAG: metallophosphoesterase [Myxococcales bacterium]|nr:metallophosphoesterase [Myxococcales bacterium]
MSGTGMPSAAKLLRLPAQGRLLVATDLRGNVRDFMQIVARFERLSTDGYLLLLGDLIHGPYLTESEWDPRLGRYYRDESPGLLMKLSLLQERYPGRVHALLGNHEHAHVGGPHTARFAADEVQVLEQRLGAEVAEWLRQWLAGWPLWAIAPCGILFSHGAPGQAPAQLEELEDLDYRRWQPLGQTESQDPRARLLGKLLWTRSLSPPEARRVLHVAGCHLMVYGREVVEGYEVIGQEQLILASSFGLPDDKKRILELDLGARYESVAALREGHEILPLYR